MNFRLDVILWGLVVLTLLASIRWGTNEPAVADESVPLVRSETPDLEFELDVEKTFTNAALSNLAELRRLFEDARSDYVLAETLTERRLLRTEMRELIQGMEFTTLRLYNMCQTSFWNNNNPVEEQ